MRTTDRRPGMTRRTILGAGLSLGTAALPGAHSAARAQPAAQTQAGRARLRILSTTDLHATIRDWDYIRDRADPTIGLTRTAALIAAARAESDNSLLVDCGDLLQGGPLADWVAYERGLKPGEIHPVFAAMGALGYDAGTLGNHDFDYGLEFLDACLPAAPFPLVASNIARIGGGGELPRRLMLERPIVDEAGGEGVLRIGLVGLVPPQTMIWNRGRLEGRIAITEMVEAARTEAPLLRAEGADLVLALCHGGIVAAGAAGEREHPALALARLGLVDAIVAGHQHLLFPGPAFRGIDGVDAEAGLLAGTPTVMPGFWGSHLGLLDLELDRTDAGWRLAGGRAALRAIARRDGETVTPLVEADPAIDAAVEDAHRATRRYVAQPIGETTTRIASHWALVADDAGVQLVNAAQTAHARRFIGGTVDEILPLLSASAPFRAGGRAGPDAYVDIPAGPLPLRRAADLYIHPNQLAVVRIGGSGLREWLEFAAGLFNRIDPALTDPQPLIDPDFPIANFDVIDGISYRIDVTQPRRYDPDGRLVDPAAQRIRNLSWNLMPIEPTNLFLVATNNYRVAGGGNVPGVSQATQVAASPDMTRDVLTRWIFEQGTIAPEADRNWAILPLPDGVVATYDTAPAAVETVPPGLTATPLGPTPEGFLRFQLAFG